MLSMCGFTTSTSTSARISNFSDGFLHIAGLQGSQKRWILHFNPLFTSHLGCPILLNVLFYACIASAGRLYPFATSPLSASFLAFILFFSPSTPNYRSLRLRDRSLQIPDAPQVSTLFCRCRYSLQCAFCTARLRCSSVSFLMFFTSHSLLHLPLVHMGCIF